MSDKNKAGIGMPPLPGTSLAQEGGAFSTRIRLVEEKAYNLNRKIELLESNVVKGNKKKNDTLRAFDNELLDLKREVGNVKQKVNLIISELKMTAGKDELNTVKRYLDLWDLTRFVSRDELEHIIEEKVESLLQKVKS